MTRDSRFSETGGEFKSVQIRTELYREWGASVYVIATLYYGVEERSVQTNEVQRTHLGIASPQALGQKLPHSQFLVDLVDHRCLLVGKRKNGEIKVGV